MVSHPRLVPDEGAVPIIMSAEALRVARLQQTSIPGDIATDGTISAGGMQVTDLQVKGQNILDSIEAMRPQIEQAEKDAAAASGRADELGKRADAMAGQITDVQRTVTDQGVKVEASVTKANQALEASSETKQTLTELSDTVKSHYSEQQGVNQATLDRFATVDQTVNGISQTVSSNYKELKDGQETTNDRVTTVETTADGLSAKVDQAYSTAGKALDQTSALQLSQSKFETDVQETYATKDSVTTLSTQWKQDKDGFTANIQKAQSTANTANSAASKAQATANTANSTATAAANGAKSGNQWINTVISLKSDGVTVGRNVNGTPAYNFTKMSSDGFFRVISRDGKKTMFQAGQDLLYIGDQDGNPRINMTSYDDNHFYITIKPLTTNEPNQVWNTGWTGMALNTGSGAVQYAHRGGILCFRGRVNAPAADTNLNKYYFPNIGTASWNRNFCCWGMTNNNGLAVANVYMAANTKFLRVGSVSGGWKWVSLDGLQIPT